jgi:hypothetical protein
MRHFPIWVLFFFTVHARAKNDWGFQDSRALTQHKVLSGIAQCCGHLILLAVAAQL